MSSAPPPRSGQSGNAVAPGEQVGARWRVPSLVAAGVVAGVSCLLLLVSLFAVAVLRSGGYSQGYAASTKVILALIGLLAATGLVAALVIALTAVRVPRRPAASAPGRRVTSLRTRSLGVIAAVVLIPSLCLASFGVWAYFKSWERAQALYQQQAYYRATLLNDEIAGLTRSPAHFSAAERARLAAAIADQYGYRGNLEGASMTTLSDLRSNDSLPGWMLRSLHRQGYAIGNAGGSAGPEWRAGDSDLVAWIGPSGQVYVYAAGWSYPTQFSAYAPLGRLFWIGLFGVALTATLGLLGAWILSRSVVRPVRRLAEASGRLAEGEAGVTVKPEGPRELRELAASFNDMNAKLAKAQEAEQSFLLSVSHELKTPLTSVRGYAEGISDGTVEPADGAAVIGAESSRLERLVGDLLDSARMRKSAFTVRREAIDLAAVAQDVARRYEGTARDAGLALNLKTEPGSTAVADGDRVLQVVCNLVENAIRCTPPPGTVTITTARGVVAVADTGRGLTSDDLPRAFERFYLYSRYGNDRPVGTGLGLAIVKELSEAMGGSVSVTSAVGVGTAFTVALPAESPPPDDPAVPAPAAPPADPAAAPATEPESASFAPSAPEPSPGSAITSAEAADDAAG
jgi:signal transduction histidine kinase